MFAFKSGSIVIIAVIGLLHVIIGLLLFYIGVPYIIEDQLHKKVAVRNGSDTYPIWRKLDFVEFNTYMFNITNPNEVSQGQKPIVKEVGPFCYRMHKHKNEILVNETDDTIVYDEYKYYYPATTTNLTEKKCVPHDTQLTMINIALAGSVQTIGDMSPYFLQTFSETIPFMFPNITDGFIRATAQQILFDGFTLNCSSQEITVGLICKAMKVLAPPQIKLAANGKDFEFSMLGWMNASRIGPFKINSGVKNMSQTGNTLEWNGNKVMKIWPEPRCNVIKGTDGYILPPLKETDLKIDVFGVDVCRSFSLQYKEDRIVKGIEVRRFETTVEILDNSKENECFCPRSLDQETNKVSIHCLKQGVMSLANCFNKAPVILSWPHFYLGAQEYVNGVQGLNPDPELHKSVADIQKPLGAPVFGVKRAQMNMFLQQNDIVTMFANVTDTLMPLVWIEEGAYTPDVMLDELQKSTQLLGILNIVLQIIIYVGLGVTILAALGFMCNRSKSKPYILNK